LDRKDKDLEGITISAKIVKGKNIVKIHLKVLEN